VDLKPVLDEAFDLAWDAQSLVNQLIQELNDQTSGEVTLQYADPATFSPNMRIRGKAAYLFLTARKRLRLSPDPASVVVFDSPAGGFSTPSAPTNVVIFDSLAGGFNRLPAPLDPRDPRSPW
jgi:hypothetical protein